MLVRKIGKMLISKADDRLEIESNRWEMARLMMLMNKTDREVIDEK